MVLEDANPTSLSWFARSVEMIRENECYSNGEGQDDDGRESPHCHHIEPDDKVIKKYLFLLILFTIYNLITFIYFHL